MLVWGLVRRYKLYNFHVSRDLRISPEDGDSIFHWNFGIYQLVYRAPKHKRSPISSSTPSPWKFKYQFFMIFHVEVLYALHEIDMDRRTDGTMSLISPPYAILCNFDKWTKNRKNKSIIFSTTEIFKPNFNRLQTRVPEFEFPERELKCLLWTSTPLWGIE